MNIEISKPILIYGFGIRAGRTTDSGRRSSNSSKLGKGGEISGVAFDSNYQLNAEDALAVAECRKVVFVDAAQEGPAPFEFRPLAPQKEISFSTHAMPPESVLALADELYGARPPAWLLAIRGESWEPNEPPTAAALSHLAAAREFLQAWLRGSG